MKTKKSKALKSLAADLNTYDMTHNGEKGTIQSLVECCLNIPNENKRKKAISEIIGKSENVRKLLSENEALVTAEVEQALIRAATGYTVVSASVLAGVLSMLTSIAGLPEVNETDKAEENDE